MHDDARLALAAFADGREAWVRFTPEVVADMGQDQHLLVDAVEEFESLDNPAGRAATEWLKSSALDWDGTTLTYLMLLERRIEAFYAAASQSVLLSQRHVKHARGEKLSPVDIPRRQPATFIAWLAKQVGARTSGIKVLEHAFGTAAQVAELQGNVALVLDPYDEATSELWIEMDVGFRRSANDRTTNQVSDAEHDSRERRLWMPLREADQGFM